MLSVAAGDSERLLIGAIRAEASRISGLFALVTLFVRQRYMVYKLIEITSKNEYSPANASYN